MKKAIFLIMLVTISLCALGDEVKHESNGFMDFKAVIENLNKNYAQYSQVRSRVTPGLDRIDPQLPFPLQITGQIIGDISIVHNLAKLYGKMKSKDDADRVVDLINYYKVDRVFPDCRNAQRGMVYERHEVNNSELQQQRVELGGALESACEAIMNWNPKVDTMSFP